MKQKIRIIDTLNNKIIEGEKTLRDFDHFKSQLKFKSFVFKSKKGKGSYTRKRKYKKF